MLAGQIAHAAEAENIDENIRRLGFDRFYTDLRKDKNRQVVKVAIFDYGFSGYEDEKGYTIPKNTEFKQRPGDTNKTSGGSNTHGLAMAQIVTQYMTNNYTRWRFAPKVYLYKSDGYSNFQWAIDDAIKNGVDVILHSIVIEYGSNYDGRGFYNALVNKATNAGIIWINAAGNFGLTTYNSDVVVGKNNWVEMDGLDKNALPVKCTLPKKSSKKSKEKKCKIRVVLAWDDFKNKPSLGTKKDLDLYLYDENLESSVSSELTQVEENDKRASQPGTTLYPREIIETQIDEGTSYIKVKAKSDNFASTDKLRITADGDNIQFPKRDEEESLLNPADNPSVITVGEDSPRSSVSRRLDKPELIAPSLVMGDDGKQYKGSSNAAAVVAAGVALMKKINPDLDRDDVLELVTAKNATPNDIMNYPKRNEPRPMMVVPMGPPGYLPPELTPSFIQSQVAVQSDHYVPPGDEETQPQDEDYVESRKTKHKKRKSTQERYEEEGPQQNGVLVVPEPRAIPASVLGFGPLQGNGCYAAADIKKVEPCVVGNFIIKSQSLLVVTTGGLKIATSYDPEVLLRPGDGPRQDVRDVIAIVPTDAPQPFIRLPRGAPLPAGAIEIFKMQTNEMACKIPDWNFLMTELDISRRSVYEANATGVYNNYIPQSCRIDVLAQSSYLVSDWSMYPMLRYSPYGAPIGPAPVEIRSSYQIQQGDRGHGREQLPPQDQRQYQPRYQQSSHQSRQGDSFQLPNPDDVKDEN